MHGPSESRLGESERAATTPVRQRRASLLSAGSVAAQCEWGSVTAAGPAAARQQYLAGCGADRLA
jgi:hypothetical protein